MSESFNREVFRRGLEAAPPAVRLTVGDVLFQEREAVARALAKGYTLVQIHRVLGDAGLRVSYAGFCRAFSELREAMGFVTMTALRKANKLPKRQYPQPVRPAPREESPSASGASVSTPPSGAVRRRFSGGLAAAERAAVQK